MVRATHLKTNMVYVAFIIIYLITIEEVYCGETESDSTQTNNLEKVQNDIGIDPNEVKNIELNPIDSSGSNENNFVQQEMPSEFDARNNWPMCTIIEETMIYEDNVENSWATVISSVLADRICIAQGEQFNEHLSIKELLSCCKGCKTSGSKKVINKSWKYYEDYGAFSEPHFIKSDVCPPRKSVIDPKYRRKISKVYTLNSIYEIKKDILTYGPVSASLKIYGDEYQATDRRFDTIQDKIVKIIGWGTIDDIPFWLCLRPIGDSWYFRRALKVNMGPPDPNFEGIVIVGQPKYIVSNAMFRGFNDIGKAIQTEIPSYFDARDVWPMCTTIGQTIVYKTNNKQFWAVATSSALADRICIAQDAQFNEHLSFRELLGCCEDCNVAGISDMRKIENAWEYYKAYGAFSEEHFKYYLDCPTEEPRYDHLKFRWKISHVYTLNNVNEIKKDILKHGPVAAVLSSKKISKDYSKSNYDHQAYYLKSVKIIGWGEEDDIPHWLCLLTSFSTSWNDMEPLKLPMELSDPNINGIVIAGKPIVKDI